MREATCRWRWWRSWLLVILGAFGLVLGGCDGGSSGTSGTSGTAEPLTAPEVQSYVGDTYVVLDWQPVAGATDYNVYMTSDGSDPLPIVDNLHAEGVQPPFVDGDWLKDGAWITGQGELPPGTYRYVVTARTQAEEGPCSSCVVCALVVPEGGIWRIEGEGNNLSEPLLFAEGRGLSGLVVSDENGLPLFENTVLRTPAVVKVDGDTVYTDPLQVFDPLVAGEITTQPIFYEDDLIPAFDVLTGEFTGAYAYAQMTASTWQADWEDGSAEPQEAVAKWGDNLTGHQWPASQDVLRVEVTLAQPTTGMTGYEMISLFGGKYAEFKGTTGVTFDAVSRWVYTPHARLQIERMAYDTAPPLPAGFDWTAQGAVGAPLYDGAVWESYLSSDSEASGTFAFGAEVNGGGTLSYGYVWMLKSQGVAPGWYRLTFRLDAEATCTQVASVVPSAEGEVTLEADPDPVAVNTFLVEAAPEVVPEAEGEGATFPALLIEDPDREGGTLMSVLHIYLGT